MEGKEPRLWCCTDHLRSLATPLPLCATSGKVLTTLSLTQSSPPYTPASPTPSSFRETTTILTPESRSVSASCVSLRPYLINTFIECFPCARHYS